MGQDYEVVKNKWSGHSQSKEHRGQTERLLNGQVGGKKMTKK